MNLIRYFMTGIRLRLALRRALIMKDKTLSAIWYSRKKSDQVDAMYQHFLNLSAKQERIAVEYRRLKSRHTNRPILQVRLELGNITVSSSAQKMLTAFDKAILCTRHQYGDWGTLSPVDWQRNNELIKNAAGTVCSRHPLLSEGCLLIRTDLKKHQTRIELEGENK